MRRVRYWIAVSLLFVAAGGAYLLWSARPRPVTVANSRVGPAAELVYATGFVEAEQPVTVSARFTAPVTQILVDEGDPVRRGQALLILDSDDVQGQVAQTAAQSRGATLTEQRTTTLFREGWVTRAARDEAVAAADSARAAERVARAHLAQNIVRANIDGIVLKRDVEPGELATPTRILMLLGNPARTRVTATVDERDLPRIHVGQAALLSSDAWPGRLLHGHVRALTPGGDPAQRAFRVRLALDDASALPMGLTLEVNIVTRHVERAILIPAPALTDGHVWIVEAGRAHRRPVRTGITGTGDVQILSGVSVNASVIVDPPADLREGERVRPRSGAS